MAGKRRAGVLKLKALHDIEDENLENVYDFIVTVNDKIRLVSVALKNVLQHNVYKVVLSTTEFSDMVNNYFGEWASYSTHEEALDFALKMANLISVLGSSEEMAIEVHDHAEDMYAPFSYVYNETLLQFNYVVVASIKFSNRTEMISICRLVL